MRKSLFFVFTFFLFSAYSQAQITAPQADGRTLTGYPSFPENDSIYVFCVSDSLAQKGDLTVTTALSGTKTFLWEKYNEQTANFELYLQESTTESSSQIGSLPDGCYRATVTQAATTKVYRAWVFNNWTIADATISDSNCKSFTLNGSFKTATLKYYDLSNNASLTVSKNVRVNWLKGADIISTQLAYVVQGPPAENTNYTLRVYDKFDCERLTNVTYESIVPEAAFSFDPSSGEAPLAVTFSNTSKNATSNYYEWFLLRDLNDIKAEIQQGATSVDSVMTILYDDSPAYTYQNSGEYMVKLVAKHVSDTCTCADTLLMDGTINIDSSFIKVPNVFTPNGDGVNDDFVVKYWSMKSLEIYIYNRWGKRVFSWKNSNIQGYEETHEESIWDGKIGGRKASPGVYYWDVSGRGRDGRKRAKHGFVHLFREK